MPEVLLMPDDPLPTDAPVLAPYAVTVPEGARRCVAPFLGVGEVVVWRYQPRLAERDARDRHADACRARRRTRSGGGSRPARCS